MKQTNIPIFIPHVGCKHMCSFCNQRTISGTTKPPRADDVIAILEAALRNLKEQAVFSEIAFFGGSFTAVPHDYMLELLEATKPFIHKFRGICISTRPDAISVDVLKLLKGYGVTTIELGAQSMNNKVLSANNRGHTAEDIVKASCLVKKHGFSLGLQMMTGLYKSTKERDYTTAVKIAELKPDCVRIYPTVVLKSTDLHKLYDKGAYLPPDIEESAELCAELLLFFEEQEIPVIRLGLHASEETKADYIAGAYHPAFRELCESRIFLKKLMELSEKKPKGELCVFVNEKSVSKLVGQKRENIIKMANLGYILKIKTDNKLGKYQLNIE